MSKFRTPSCDAVWCAIDNLRMDGVDVQELEDAFTDFECAWGEHLEEFHQDDVHRKVDKS